MPTISLRLTEEEHAALKAWAHDSKRSIQKEAVFRLFSDLPALFATKVVEAERAREQDDHFKPDFGKKLK